MGRRHRSEEALPDLGELDVLTLGRRTGHPVLAAVARGLAARTLAGERAVAFYEDAP